MSALGLLCPQGQVQVSSARLCAESLLLTQLYIPYLLPLLSLAELCSGPIRSVVTGSAILSLNLNVAFQVAQICVLRFSTVLAFYCGFIPLQFLPDLFLCSSLTQLLKSSPVDSCMYFSLTFKKYKCIIYR